MSSQKSIEELAQQVARLSQELMGENGKVSTGGTARMVHCDAYYSPYWIVSARIVQPHPGRDDAVYVTAQRPNLTTGLLVVRRVLGETLRGERAVIGGDV